MDTSLDGSSSNPTLSSMSSTSSLTSSVSPTPSSLSGTTDPTDSVSPTSSTIASVPTSTSRAVDSSSFLPSPVPSTSPVVRSRAPDQAKESSSLSETTGRPEVTSETSSKSSKPASDDPVPPTIPSKPSPPPTDSPHNSSTPSATHSPAAPTTPPKPSNPAPPQASSQSKEAKNSGTSSAPETKPKELPPSSSSNITQSSTQALASEKSGSNTTQSSGTSLASTPSNAVSVTAADSNAKSSAAAHQQLATTVPTLTSDVRVHSTSSGSSTPTSALTSHAPSGFFANRGTVAGVFVIVGLVALGLFGLLIMGLVRRCRRRRHEILSESREPTFPELHSNEFEGEPHYRRMSQVLAFSNVLSAGAPAAGSNSIRHYPSFVRSDESHARSLETYHSVDPIMRSEKNPFTDRHMIPSPVPEDLDVPPYQQSTNPFLGVSRYSVQSAVNSSPSIYPPTLPVLNAEEEDDYWRTHERRPTPDPTLEEEDIAHQRTMPPHSSLGLWTDHSQTTVTPYNISENELVGNLDPRMQPGPVHKGSTAPIASTGALKYRYDGGYLLDNTWKVPNRGGTPTH